MTDFTLHVEKFSSKEIACFAAFPYENSGVLACSDLASWHSVNSETSWETSPLEFVEWSADWLSSWWLWVKWHSSSEGNPSVTLESVPSMIEIL